MSFRKKKLPPSLPNSTVPVICAPFGVLHPIKGTPSKKTKTPPPLPPKSPAPINAPFGILHPVKGIPSILDDYKLIEKYLECNGEKNCLNLGLHFIHRPQIWSQIYHDQLSPNFKRVMRCLIQIQTIQAVLRGKYYVEIDSDLPIPVNNHLSQFQREKFFYPVLLDRKKMVQSSLSTVKYDSDFKYQFLASKNPNYPTKYLVVDGDCLEVALHLAGKFPGEPEPIVLDMASFSLPGGGWKKGSSAQEENLHRRTNLFQCLEDPYRINVNRKWSYPLPQFGGVYVKRSCVFRGEEKEGYPFLSEPKYLSFVAATAFKMPPTEDKNGEEILDKKIGRETGRKIEGILNIALENGHTILVLSAFGCGTYMNPTAHMARLFRDTLRGGKYQGRFKCVAFAIIEPEIRETAKIFAKTMQVELLCFRGDCGAEMDKIVHVSV